MGDFDVNIRWFFEPSKRHRMPSGKWRVGDPLGFLQGGPRIPVISRDLETPVTKLCSAMYTQCTTDKSPPCWFLYVPSFCEANTGIIYDLCGRWSKGIIWGLHQLKILWLTKSSNMTLSGVFFWHIFFCTPKCGDDFQFDVRIFFRWVETQPPTRWLFKDSKFLLDVSSRNIWKHILQQSRCSIGQGSLKDTNFAGINNPTKSMAILMDFPKITMHCLGW